MMMNRNRNVECIFVVLLNQFKKEKEKKKKKERKKKGQDIL
jgi:hypothetical protein